MDTTSHSPSRPRRFISFALATLLAAGCGKRYGPQDLGASPPRTRDSVRAPNVAPLPTADGSAPQSPSAERYAFTPEHAFLPTAEHPLSTFAIDVDTASYANVRRFLEDGHLPVPDAVRLEELVNYFPYAAIAPAEGHPLGVVAEVGPCPWSAEHLLARVRVAAPAADALGPPVAKNLVFLVDVSGSMSDRNKLPLLVDSLGRLVDHLGETDRVSLVVYAGAAGVVLEPTSGAERGTIKDALGRLLSGGSTNGGEGIRAAYALAKQAFIRDGENRVILATDGDFNVGVEGDGELVRLIESERKTGVYLTVLGFGGGNLNDSGLEKLADHGNGNYFYIDSEAEAEKVLVEGGGANLVTLARDVKIQVEMNPSAVAEYRLLGYENRALRDEQFADDRVDGGEMGPGHTVTALYELVRAGASKAGAVPLRYQTNRDVTARAGSDELFTVKVRYQSPRVDATDASRLIEVAAHAPEGDLDALSAMSDDFRFAAAVAAFGMLLGGSNHQGTATFADIRKLAEGALGEDTDGHRAEFLTLVERARRLAAAGPHASEDAKRAPAPDLREE